MSTSSWVPAAELKDASRKPWKLHVVHLQRNGEFRAEDKKLMKRMQPAGAVVAGLR